MFKEDYGIKSTNRKRSGDGIGIRRTFNFASDLTKNWPKKRSIRRYVSILRTIFCQIWSKSGRSPLPRERLPQISPLKWILGLWLVLGMTSVILAPIPSLESVHYLGMAWNMFKENNWLVAHFIEGTRKVDLEKTPLLYWFFIAAWHLLGVSALSAKAIIFALGTANMFLTYILAKEFFPENEKLAWISLLVLLCNLLWTEYFGTDIRFEGLIVFFGLLFLIFLLQYLHRQKIGWLIAAGFSFGFCLFSKGAVGLIYYLPLAIFLPVFVNKKLTSRWFFSLIAIIPLFLMPVAVYLACIYFIVGGNEFHYLLFGQISKRVGIHLKISGLMGLIASFAPIIFLFRFKKSEVDKRIVILLAQIIFIFLFFSLGVITQTKRYFIPICPLLAMVIAYFVDLENTSNKRMFTLAVIFVGVMMINDVWESFDERARFYKSLGLMGNEIKSLQIQGHPTALVTHKFRAGVLDFFGELPNDVPDMHLFKSQWLKDNPQGYAVDECPGPHQEGNVCLQPTSLTL